MAAIGRVKLERNRRKGSSAHEKPEEAQPKARNTMPGGWHAGAQWVAPEPQVPPHHVSLSLDQQLLLAAACGKEGDVRSLLEQKADVNARDSDGNTPLILASKGGHMDTMRVLLLYCADANAQNDNGDTAKCWQTKDGRMEIADDEALRLLKAFGAD